MKSELLVELDKALAAVYGYVEASKQKFAKKFLRETLQDFGSKYPMLGQLKDDLLSVVYFMTIRVVGVVVVLPACTLWACYELSRNLFKKK